MSTWSTTLHFEHLPVASSDTLPTLSLIDLSDWSLVTLVGDDKKSYLQGQVTCDVVTLDPAHSTFGAHCDAKGKMRTIFRIFHHQQGYALLQRKSIMATQLPELKKYAVFSKVDIEEGQDVLLGLCGENAQTVIDQHFPGTDDVRAFEGGTAVKVDAQRWLIAVAADHADTLATQLANNAQLATTSLWDLYDIKAAFPRIEAATELEFIPQAMNLHAVGGISFKKGCYVGQETVARAKYRGTNKRAMYQLQGASEQCPQAGDVLERSVGENWRKGGTVIAGYQFSDNQAITLVVLPNDLDEGTQFRLAEHPEALWTVQALPYSLDDE